MTQEQWDKMQKAQQSLREKALQAPAPPPKQKKSERQPPFGPLAKKLQGIVSTHY